ncbi:hypothetical protein Taro_027754 [Colocasia esculenta]|uniref:Uncharacterized protein n=1 Tax=Colocasia esculenta TaxID=4460 RepID=A0A843VSC8_COLES|nr:hypothetical protein [Colocasia esculenta]
MSTTGRLCLHRTNWHDLPQHTSFRDTGGLMHEPSHAESHVLTCGVPTKAKHFRQTRGLAGGTPRRILHRHRTNGRPLAQRGIVPADVTAGEGVEHPVAVVPARGGTPSLQTIHDLLVSGPETELPGFFDFASSMLEGGAWPQALHSAMFIFSPSADIAGLVEEMMESNPPAAIPPPVASAAGAETASHGAAATSSALGFGEPSPGESSDALASEGLHPPKASHLRAAIEGAGGEGYAAEGGADVPGPSGVQVIGSDMLQPPPGAVPSAGFDAFPNHDVLWPSEPQSIQILDDGGILFDGACKVRHGGE